MSGFPEEKHLRKIEHLNCGKIALFDQPMRWDPDKKPKITTVLLVRVTKDRPKVGVIAEVEHYDADYVKSEKTVFPIDQDRGIKAAPEDAERIVKDCADEMFLEVLRTSEDSLKAGGILKIILPDDELLYKGFELAVQARTNPQYRKKI